MLERELKYFSWLNTPGYGTYKMLTYEPKMVELRKNIVKYNIIFDILDYMDIYHKKVGIESTIKVITLLHHISLPEFSLREIKHKWMKLSENPNIPVEDIYKNFK